MAVEDLNTLRQQLPEVFEDLTVPDTWDDEWIIVPEENPEAGLYEQGVDARREPSIEDLLTGAPSTEALTEIPDWGPDSDLPDFGGVEAFPGRLVRKRDRDCYPRPDAFAFYLPFHFFYPRWWGIYLVLEPALQ